jgi:tRNA(His) 5'-end guanylyltransferase
MVLILQKGGTQASFSKSLWICINISYAEFNNAFFMLNNFLKLISFDSRCDLRSANMLGNLLQNCLFSSECFCIILSCIAYWFLKCSTNQHLRELKALLGVKTVSYKVLFLGTSEVTENSSITTSDWNLLKCVAYTEKPIRFCCGSKNHQGLLSTH